MSNHKKTRKRKRKRTKKIDNLITDKDFNIILNRPKKSISKMNRSQLIRELKKYRNAWQNITNKHADLDDERLNSETTKELRLLLKGITTDEIKVIAKKWYNIKKRSKKNFSRHKGGSNKTLSKSQKAARKIKVRDDCRDFLRYIDGKVSQKEYDEYSRLVNQSKVICDSRGIDCDYCRKEHNKNEMDYIRNLKSSKKYSKTPVVTSKIRQLMKGIKPDTMTNKLEKPSKISTVKSKVKSSKYDPNDMKKLAMFQDREKKRTKKKSILSRMKSAPF